MQNVTKGLLVSVLLFGGCSVNVNTMDPEAVAHAYLKAIESEDFKKAYMLIDGISKQYTPYKEFVKYWKNYFKKYGHPYKHTIHEIAKLRPGWMMVEYTWHFKRDKGVDTAAFLDQRSYRMKLRFEFRRWAVKFRKYRLIKETPTPFGVQREVIEE
ncbi:MAG: hypothetical protein GXO39_09235 [Thermotogae bacterium]|nr:hypothetical protein [Thermotogota bacterium]